MSDAATDPEAVGWIKTPIDDRLRKVRLRPAEGVTGWREHAEPFVDVPIHVDGLGEVTVTLPGDDAQDLAEALMAASDEAEEAVEAYLEEAEPDGG